MAAIPGGVRVQGFIAPTSTTDTYPVTDPHYGLGGLRTVLNLGQRDLIPAERRIVGMLVFVQQQNKYYKLLADLVQWEEVDLSNILTNESDPTVPLHVKRIPAGNANGQILRWNGSDWVLTTLPPETDPTVPTHVKQIPQGSTNGQILRWNGTQWTAADGSQLPAGTQAGQILQWNGTTWIAANIGNLLSSSSLFVWPQSNNSVAIELYYSGVTAGTYGDSNNIPQLTIDPYGRVISATTVPIGSSGGGDTPDVPPPPTARFDIFYQDQSSASGAIVIETSEYFNLPVGYNLCVEFRGSFTANENETIQWPFYLTVSAMFYEQNAYIYSIEPVNFLGYYAISRISENTYTTKIILFAMGSMIPSDPLLYYYEGASIAPLTELSMSLSSPDHRINSIEVVIDSIYITSYITSSTN